MWEQSFTGGEARLSEEEEARLAHSTPSPAQPAHPLWPLLQTPALTHTPPRLQFCLKGPS